jgi:DNA-binding beta-propeller fold protein YncE
VGTFYGSLINGPWDMTALDQGSQSTLFFTNVLNGTVAANGNVVHGGTVVRMVLSIPANSKPAIESMTVIGSGFSERTDPAALVIGPTGVGLSGTTLYVADSLNNRVTAIANATTITSTAGTGTVFSKNGFLNDPLGLTIDPSTGNVLVTNGNNGALVTIDPSGTQTRNALDTTGSPPGAGTLFGLVSVPGTGVYFVDDGSNTLNLFQQPGD